MQLNTCIKEIKSILEGQNWYAFTHMLLLTPRFYTNIQNHVHESLSETVQGNKEDTQRDLEICHGKEGDARSTQW